VSDRVGPKYRRAFTIFGWRPTGFLPKLGFQLDRVAQQCDAEIEHHSGACMSNYDVKVGNDFEGDIIFFNTPAVGVPWRIVAAIAAGACLIGACCSAYAQAVYTGDYTTIHAAVSAAIEFWHTIKAPLK
jgi:hypothetical protein